MCYILIITIHETNLILFIKRLDFYSFLIIQIIYKIRILNNHHPFCTTFIDNIVC